MHVHGLICIYVQVLLGKESLLCSCAKGIPPQWPDQLQNAPTVLVCNPIIAKCMLWSKAARNIFEHYL